MWIYFIQKMLKSFCFFMTEQNKKSIIKSFLLFVRTQLKHKCLNVKMWMKSHGIQTAGVFLRRFCISDIILFSLLSSFGSAQILLCLTCNLKWDVCVWNITVSWSETKDWNVKKKTYTRASISQAPWLVWTSYFCTLASNPLGSILVVWIQHEGVTPTNI